MNPASYAPMYCALYPKLAEIARKHGYALAVHGTLQRDMDLICIPWAEKISEPQNVIDAITHEFSIRQIGDPEIKQHGRLAYTISIGFADCFIDLSFVQIPHAALVAALPREGGLHDSIRELDSSRLDWLDQHCAFVADGEYKIGPFKIGELRQLADAGMAQDFCGNRVAALPKEDSVADTGNPEADRIINRLMSDDPDFDDCVEASIFIRKLVCEHCGPDGFPTWKDAAIAERLKRTTPVAQPDAEEVLTLSNRLGWHADAFEQGPDALAYSTKIKDLRLAAAILARIDALLKSGGWISVEDRLPEETDVYQVAFSNGGYWLSAFRAKDKVWLLDDDLIGEIVTHWNPTSPLPQEKGRSEDCKGDSMSEMKPVRIQLKRTKGWKMPLNTVKVDRSTKWGNPFVPGKPVPFGPLQGRIVEDKRHAFTLYRSFAPLNPTLIATAKAELRGKNLACWCGQDDPYEDQCHAAVLLEIANS